MSKNTTVLLGDHFDRFIEAEIESGKYQTADEVVRSALRLLEKEEKQMNWLREQLEEGEQSPVVEMPAAEDFIQSLKKKHG